MDSVIVTHGLSCPMACGTFLDQGSNLCPLHWEVDSLPLDHQCGSYFGDLDESSLSEVLGQKPDRR